MIVKHRYCTENHMLSQAKARDYCGGNVAAATRCLLVTCHVTMTVEAIKALLTQPVSYE